MWIVLRRNGKTAAGVACSESHAHKAALHLGTEYREIGPLPTAAVWCVWCGADLHPACGSSWPEHSMAVTAVVEAHVLAGFSDEVVDRAQASAVVLAPAVCWDPHRLVAAVAALDDEGEPF